MKKDGTAAYGTVFQVIFVITDDINLNVNLLSTIRAANLHLIKGAHYNSRFAIRNIFSSSSLTAEAVPIRCSLASERR
jgi:hypothetical protein